MVNEVNYLYEFGPFRLIPNEHSLFQNAKPIKLPPKAFDVLFVLIKKSGQLVTKGELMKEVWPDSFVEEGNINLAILQVRKALGDKASDPTYIETVPRRGFRFIADVKKVPIDEAVPSAEQITKAGIETEKSKPVDIDPGKQSSEQETAREVADELTARTQLPFNGHFWFVLASCSIYTCIYVVSLFMEIAYQYDIYGANAVKLSPLIITWILLTSIAGVRIDWKRTMQGRAEGLWLSSLILLIATAVLFIVLLQFLPSFPITQASFQTHTAQAAYLKEICYAYILAVLFLLMPFHFVVAMEREIAKGERESVLSLLRVYAWGSLPKGTIYVKPHLLTFLLGIITLWSLLARVYVLDQLLPAPYMNFFMEMYYIRVFLFLAFPAYCLIWYYRAVNDLNRN